MDDVDVCRNAFAVLTALANDECDLAKEILKEVSDPGELRTTALYLAGLAKGVLGSLVPFTACRDVQDLLAVVGPRLEFQAAAR